LCHDPFREKTVFSSGSVAQRLFSMFGGGCLLFPQHVVLMNLFLFVERSSTKERTHRPLPPSLEMIATRTPAHKNCARSQQNSPVGTTQIHNFTIFKLHSTTGQMPALVYIPTYRMFATKIREISKCRILADA
jgi:hypothetical protein